MFNQCLLSTPNIIVLMFRGTPLGTSQEGYIRATSGTSSSEVVQGPSVWLPMWILAWVLLMITSSVHCLIHRVGPLRAVSVMSEFHRTSNFALSAVRKRTTRLDKWDIAKKGSSSSSAKRKKGGKSSQGLVRGKGEEGEALSAEGRDVKSGLVIERLGDRLLVQPEDDPGDKLLCSQRSRLCESLVVVGDKVDFFEFEEVEVQGGQEEVGGSKFGSIKGVVVDHQERRNLLQRPSGGGNVRVMKSIAANVDQVILVVAGKPLVPLPTIDRVLVTAHKYDMRCIIVLNKADDDEYTIPFRKSMHSYSELGYRIIEVSAKDGDGMGNLRDALRGQSSVFVGQSGVGKSSLVNALLPDANARVGDLVRSTNQIGAHTTSSSHLFHLPGTDGSRDGTAGTIIDSPGIREIGLWHLPVEDIREGFVEINEASKRCKYRNCKHTFNQDGCAVIADLEAGLISTRRYDSYMDLVDL